MRETIKKMGTGKMWEENEELWQSRHRLTGLNGLHKKDDHPINVAGH
jgi:hypothetical protein